MAEIGMAGAGRDYQPVIWNAAIAEYGEAPSDLTSSQIKAGLRRASELGEQLPRMSPAEQRALLLTVLDRIVIQKGQLSIHVDRMKM
ncbi:MAG: hypothetical protein SGJ07_03850 [Rhodospirillaceae bacterium]|nr:hypothetical protein [Rhodospirillaceae bacterium]